MHGIFKMSDEMRTHERTMYLQASCSMALGVSLWSN